MQGGHLIGVYQELEQNLVETSIYSITNMLKGFMTFQKSCVATMSI